VIVTAAVTHPDEGTAPTIWQSGFVTETVPKSISAGETLSDAASAAGASMSDRSAATMNCRKIPPRAPVIQY
jgi:hypothetical protein